MSMRRAGTLAATGAQGDHVVATGPAHFHSTERGMTMSTSVGYRRVVIAALLLVVAALATGPAAPSAAQQLRPMTGVDLWRLGRVGSPAVSPDGRSVVYTVTRYDLATDRGRTHLWLVPVAGGEARQLTHGDVSASSPAWSPDGRSIAFVSARDGDGRQIWLMPAAGGEARQLTRVPGGAGGPAWSRDGSLLAFTSRVWVAGDESGERLRRLAESRSSARVYDDLMVRHWDMWTDGQRSQVYVVDLATGEARNLTPGAYDSPPIALGGFKDYDLSPDGAELAFVRNVAEPTAVGTGNNVWLVPTAGGDPRRLTPGDGNDVAPQYSPDGRWLAWLSQERPGFESDRSVLMLYDRRSGETRALTARLDRSVISYQWTPDSRTIFFNAQDEVNVRVYRVALRDGVARPVTGGAYDGAFGLVGNGSQLVVARQTAARPTELVLVDDRGRERRRLTRVNDALVSGLALQPIETFWHDGAGGARVQSFMVKPPHFDPSRKYPVVLLVHGGPQGAWSDNFHYRWNYNMFAAPGYVVIAPNPRGSTGYGQQFTDEISRDWGGRVFTDLMMGLDHALAEYPFLDRDRVAAAGASYGGYMMNWFQGQAGDRFRTLVNHAGVFDLRSMYGATEELWFPEWEFGGPPWEAPADYERWNPALQVDRWRTPMLVIHGQLDYRVPVEQGLGAFTALRRQGVPARLLYFPDEGHWVLRPSNALVWWETVYEWLGEWLR
jgi:dipeptidyl aminopeptidase/acylaminoacyl peptidase